MTEATAKTIEAEPEEKEGYDLTDIIPQESKCELADGVIVTLRPYTVRDARWAMMKFGGEKGLENMFKEKDTVKIVQLLYHMLIPEDKKKYQFEEKDGFDDDGKPVTVEITGPEKLMDHVRNITDFACVINSLMNCVGLSMPIRKAFENAQNVEEALSELKKKRRTGGGSSTK